MVHVFPTQQGPNAMEITWSYDPGEEIPDTVTVYEFGPNGQQMGVQSGLPGSTGVALFRNLQPSTTYRYQWCGFYPSASGGADNEVCLQPISGTTSPNPPAPPPPGPPPPPPPLPLPDPPTHLFAQALGYNKARVSWVNPNGAAKIRLNRINMAYSALDNTWDLPASATEFVDEPGSNNHIPLHPRASYFYQVEELNQASSGSTGSTNPITIPPPFYIPWSIAAASWAAGRLDVFVIGADKAMYHKYWDGTQWSPVDWEPLGGAFSSGPGVASDSVNHLDVFGIGLDWAPYLLTWDGNSWKGWSKIGDSGGSDPAVVTAAHGLIHIVERPIDAFVIGGNDLLGNLQGPLMHAGKRAIEPGKVIWQQFGSLGGAYISNPSAVAWAPGRLDVFGLGTDRAAWHTSYDGQAWHGPESLGGSFMVGASLCALSAVSWGSERLDIFGIGQGPNLSVYHKSYSAPGGWLPSNGSWESLGGTAFSAPTAVSWAANRIDVFVIGGDYNLYHKYWDGTQWAPADWEFLGGGPFHGDPVAVTQGPGSLDIFAVGEDFALHHLAYDPRYGWKPWESLGGVVGGRIGPV